MILFFFPVSPQGRVGGRVKSIIDYMYTCNSTNVYYLHIYQTHHLGIFCFSLALFLVIIYPCCLVHSRFRKRKGEKIEDY